MRRSLPWVVAALGATLGLAGVLVFAAANRPVAGDFRWAAYAPLEPGEPAQYRSGLPLTPEPTWVVSWTDAHLVGAGLVVAGVLVLAALGGYLLGRRRPAGAGR